MATRVMAGTITAAICLLLMSCDQFQFGDRYQLSKDEQGRTLRLDKRTGEISIIENGVITSLQHARDVKEQEAETIRRLGSPRSWPVIHIPQFTTQATLTTVWRDGRILYSVEFRPLLTKMMPEKDAHAILVGGLSLVLEDAPFQLAHEPLVNASRVVSEDNTPIGVDVKGALTMTKETYSRINTWNIQWRITGK